MLMIPHLPDVGLYGPEFLEFLGVKLWDGALRVAWNRRKSSFQKQDTWKVDLAISVGSPSSR